MQTNWREGNRAKQVVAPLSLIVSRSHLASMYVKRSRRSYVPCMRTPHSSVDLGRGIALGLALAQVFGQRATRLRLDQPELGAFFGVVQSLNKAGKLLAYHDRSDGGPSRRCEMMFAGHVGVSVNIDQLTVAGGAVAALFNEELVLYQIRRKDLVETEEAFESAGLAAECHPQAASTARAASS